jgi:hypothetical protein
VGLEARGGAAVARHSRVPAVLALLECLLYSYTLFSALLYSASLLYCSPPLLLYWPLFYSSTALVLYCSTARGCSTPSRSASTTLTNSSHLLTFSFLFSLFSFAPSFYTHARRWGVRMERMSGGGSVWLGVVVCPFKPAECLAPSLATPGNPPPFFFILMNSSCKAMLTLMKALRRRY